jgi:hypothetical protein
LAVTTGNFFYGTDAMPQKNNMIASPRACHLANVNLSQRHIFSMAPVAYKNISVTAAQTVATAEQIRLLAI